jgi:hypothetical protein
MLVGVLVLILEQSEGCGVNLDLERVGGIEDEVAG